MKLSNVLASIALVASSVVPFVPSKAQASIPYTSVCLDAVVYAPVSNVRAYADKSAPVTFQITKVRSLIVADAPYMGGFYKILNDEYKGGYIHYSQVSVSDCIKIW